MKKLNQSGIVSLISVVLFGLIITIVVTAYFRSAVLHQAESINLDFGTRAYYSAESGAQDAVRYLIANPSYSKNDCTPIGGVAGGVLGDEAGGLSYTCQRIENQLTAVVVGGSGDIITEDSSVQVPVPTSANSAKITWESPASNIRGSLQKRLLTKAAWNSSTTNLPAMLRTSLYTHPTGSFLNNSMQNYMTLLNPTNQNPEQQLTYNSSNNAYTNATQNEDLVHNASCVMQTNDARCSVNLNMQNFNFGATISGYLRFKPIYKEVTKLTVEFYNGNVKLSIPNVATVDVTGRSGNIFRRISQQVSLTNDPTLVPRRDISPIPDLSLGSSDDICKLQTRTDSFYNNQCN